MSASDLPSAHGKRVCGALGCAEPAVVVIQLPNGRGERVVCSDHGDDGEVVRLA